MLALIENLALGEQAQSRKASKSPPSRYSPLDTLRALGDAESTTSFLVSLHRGMNIAMAAFELQYRSGAHDGLGESLYLLLNCFKNLADDAGVATVASVTDALDSQNIDAMVILVASLRDRVRMAALFLREQPEYVLEGDVVPALNGAKWMSNE